MNQLLSDDEITLIVRECARGSAINRDGSTSHRIARTIEAKIMEKLREQEPVAFYDGNKFYANEESAICGCADMAKLKPVFTHPAPIPEGWISVEDAIPDAEVSVLVARLGRVNAQITCHTGKEWLLESNHYPVTHWRVIPRTPSCNSW